MRRRSFLKSMLALPAALAGVVWGVGTVVDTEVAEVAETLIRNDDFRRDANWYWVEFKIETSSGNFTLCNNESITIPNGCTVKNIEMVYGICPPSDFQIEIVG